MKRIAKSISTPGGKPGGWWSILAMGGCLALALYVLTFPLQDYDTFWHLAYGRAMVETRTYIDYEIFSYTAAGKFVPGQSQLAQVLLYLLWAAGGAGLLLGFKLVVAAVAFFLMVRMARLTGADTVTGAFLALAVLVAGMGRVVERPEIFTILLQTLLLWLLFQARSVGYPHRWLWPVPPLMLCWDYLHGGLFGLIILLAFVGAEVCRELALPKVGIDRFVQKTLPPNAIRRLLGWFAATLLVMLAHPNGLLAYKHIWRVRSDPAFRMFAEFMPPFHAQFTPYWLLLAAALIVILLCIRRIDPTALAVMLPFLVMSLNYNRAVLAFGIAAVPATAQALACVGERLRSVRWSRPVAALCATTLFGAVLAYKQFGVIETHRFGTGVSDLVFPVGSVRFVMENDLPGNMYNMDAFGGYLAFMAGPERKIFNYNQPGVFSALFDYLHKPETRAQWEINYAFVGRAEEVNMFRADGFVPVYREPGSAVYLRDNAANAGLISKFQVRYFNPLLSAQELAVYGKDPRTAETLLREISVYLAYRHDPRIAGIFAQLLRGPAVKDDRKKSEWLAPVLRYNADTEELLAVQGEIYYRRGEPGRAEELFRQVIARAPSNVPARIGLGYLLYDRKQFADAQSRFAAVTAEFPAVAEAHYGLGLASFRLCQRQQARKAFETFLALAPESPYAGKAKAFLANLDADCTP